MAPFTALTEYLTPGGIVMITQGSCQLATFDAFPRQGLLCDNICAGGYEFSDGRLRPTDRFAPRIIVAFKPKPSGKGFMLVDFMPWPDEVSQEDAYHQLIEDITYHSRIPH